MERHHSMDCICHNTRHSSPLRVWNAGPGTIVGWSCGPLPRCVPDAERVYCSTDSGGIPLPVLDKEPEKNYHFGIVCSDGRVCGTQHFLVAWCWGIPVVHIAWLFVERQKRHKDSCVDARHLHGICFGSYHRILRLQHRRNPVPNRVIQPWPGGLLAGL